MSNYCLDDGIKVNPQETREMLETLKGVKAGIVSVDKMYKYVESDLIKEEEYQQLCEKYKDVPKQSANPVQPKKKTSPLLFIGIAILIICIICVIKAFAHSGRTDANGGHWNHKTGTYHYHTKKNNSSSVSSSTQSSTSNSTSSYNTTSYTPSYNDRYEDGYADGHGDGYNEGYEDGYDKGKEVGYEDGHDKGYDEGEEAGYDKGKKDGQQKASSIFGGILAFGVIGLAVVSAFKS